MPCSMEYPIHVRFTVRCAATCRMQRLLPAALLFFGMLSLSFLLVSRSSAQVSGTSATSSSSGHISGGSSGGSSAGIASFGHTGYAPNHTGVTATPSHFPHGSGDGHEHHRHHASTSDAYYPYLYAVPFPYPVDAADAATTSADNDSDNDNEYQGGPTVFDRRGSGASSYVTPLYEGPAHASSADNSSAAAAEPNSLEPPQPWTTLVFKDGHQLEIENYAIVNQTLYDLTPGHPRKITIADLDLPATEKQNDDRGITFQLPPTTQSN
jgi:hypothetical protein